MHAISHTLAHRAPPASRTRARWQPYSSLPTYSAPSSSSKSSSPASYTTPATSVASPSQQTPICDIPPDKSNNPIPIPVPESLRDASTSKNKFALGLVDQAVKTLCEVWRPQDIPVAFSNPRTTRPPDLVTPLPASEQNLLSSKYRPAPHSPTTTATIASASIPTAPIRYTLPCATATPVLIQSGTSCELRNLVPVRGFVHEVLRRSRTSGCVLQTALCYLEAIRPKIPGLACLERIGKGTNGEPETEQRITKATDEEIERSRQEEAVEIFLAEGEATVRFGEDEHDVDAMDTLKIGDDEGCELLDPEGPSRNQPPSPSTLMDTSSSVEETEPQGFNSTQQSSNSPTTLPPLPYLPSPLLCPRRAFLAALILASKFTQDKCYSNRAWAKLTGLPPREIGRCERALGSALDWRLWVGKSASSSPSTSPSMTPVHRPVVRCQSEPSLNLTSPTTPDLFNRAPASESSASIAIPETATASAASNCHRVSGNRRMIRRASTLPAGGLLDIFRGPVGKQLADDGFADVTSSTLVHSDASDPSDALPSPLHAPTSFCQDPMSISSDSPSPEMPGLSYSPSSVSSSPSSCSSTGDRTHQLSAFFEDTTGSSEYFSSPVAHINTRLLVPGSGNLGSTNGGSLATQINRKPQSLLSYQFLNYPSAMSGLQGIIPQIMVSEPHGGDSGNYPQPFGVSSAYGSLCDVTVPAS